jgi:hypothetical protein
MRARTAGGLALALLGIAGLAFWLRGEEGARAPRAAPSAKLAALPPAAAAPAGAAAPLEETAPESWRTGREPELETDEPEPAGDAPNPPVPPEEAVVPPELSPFFGSGGGQPSRALVRVALASALERSHPELDVSPGDLERASDAVLRIRSVREQLAALPFTRENAARRVSLSADLEAAMAEFQDAVQLAPSELTQGLETEEGLSEFDPAEPIPEPSFIDAPPEPPAQ